jgi:signal transduction histidine kinase/CheY-like chemotaxis protein
MSFLLFSLPFWPLLSAGTWLYFVYAFGFFLAVAALVRWRCWELQRRERELMVTEETRTAELRESQEQSVEAKGVAEAGDHAKTVFLANMSHELRTPLNSILGHTQLLVRVPGQTEDQRQKLKIILSSGERLLQMINELLDLSRIEAGTAALNVQPLQLRPFLRLLVDEFQLRASQKHLAFTYSLDGTMPNGIETDSVRLQQILCNLIGNAIKFTDSGEVSLRVQRINDQMRFEVRDTGKGIPERDFPNVWMPFYQASNSDRASQSVGLGLYISKRIVSLLGGELQMRSSTESGSIFWFDLPLHEVSVPRAEPEKGRIDGYEGPQRKLLLVDDEDANRTFLRELLEHVGFKVTEARSGKAALDLMLHENFDALISDLRMSDMDGSSFCRQIRTGLKLHDLVLIASSASVYEDDKHNAISSGFDDFLPKPVREPDLLSALTLHLNLCWIRNSDPTTVAEDPEPRFASTQEAIDRPLSEPIPSPEEIQQLIRFTQRGDVMALRVQIDRLGSADGAYRIFCQRLKLVTAEFRMGAVQTILQEAARIKKESPICEVEQEVR